MRLTPKNKADLIVCLKGQPEDRAVEAEPDTGIRATTVRELRELATWPDGLVVSAPSENYPDLVLSKADT